MTGRCFHSRHHGSYGHTTESCSAEKAEVGKRSYANVARRKIVLDLEPRPRLVSDGDPDSQTTDPSKPTAGPHSDGAPIDSVRPTETATRPRLPPPHGINRDDTRRPSPAPPGGALPTVVEKGRGKTDRTTKARTETGGKGRQTDRKTADVTPPPPGQRQTGSCGQQARRGRRRGGGR